MPAFKRDHKNKHKTGRNLHAVHHMLYTQKCKWFNNPAGSYEDRQVYKQLYDKFTNTCWRETVSNINIHAMVHHQGQRVCQDMGNMFAQNDSTILVQLKAKSKSDLHINNSCEYFL